MEIVKLLAPTKDYIWGGRKLEAIYGKLVQGKTIAETWELSFRDDSPSLIASGSEAGKPLKDVASAEDIGINAARFPRFPVLIKLIDSDANLSIQVHPSDQFALSNEGEYGKTEMWHVLEAEEGSGLYVGFKRKTSPEEVRRKVEDGSIAELMNFFEVRPGESYFIPSGTIHAIGKGITLIEIQQNSDITYRLYDYGRLGKDGKPRPLHVEKALKVLRYEPYAPSFFPKPLIGECEYFSSYRYSVSEKAKIFANPHSFQAITFISGSGKIAALMYNKGDSFFLPAKKEAIIEGTGEYILTEVK